MLLLERANNGKIIPTLNIDEEIHTNPGINRLMKIGFIGLGNMGLPMALNLLKNRKYDVMGYDINPYSLRKFKKNRGKISKSLKEIINYLNKGFSNLKILIYKRFN